MLETRGVTNHHGESTVGHPLKHPLLESIASAIFAGRKAWKALSNFPELYIWNLFPKSIGLFIHFTLGCGAQAKAHVWRSEDSVWESFLFFHHVGSGA